MPEREQKLTVERSAADFKAAWQAKAKLIEREREDFLYALGEQWSEADKTALVRAGIKPVTDNRIQPNLFLLTGLERQNRSDFKAFPEGEEDGLKAEIASALFGHAVKKSGFQHKSSEQFKDGATCGESHLEFYLDFTDSLINGAPRWRKLDGNSLFPDPASREYDFSDARWVYKLVRDISREDLAELYPEKRALIEAATPTHVGSLVMEGEEKHRQHRDYPTRGGTANLPGDREEETFDLIERYYKRWVKRTFVGDRQTGEIKEAEDLATAKRFVAEYQDGVARDKEAWRDAIGGMLAAHKQTMGPQAAMHSDEEHLAMMAQRGQMVPPAPQGDPARFVVLKRSVPEVWVFAHVPGIEEPLADERAWCYPKWRGYPFVPYFARFSTAPLVGDDRHLLVQGVVHGVKGVQEKHNKAETLLLRHLNSSTNSGWLSEEDSWVDPKAVKDFGSAPGVNLEYKKGSREPQRISPVPLSVGHREMAMESAEAIKAQTGINADLIAVQEGGGDSGRAIALRQRQGLLMVQELFDNLSRTRRLAGRIMLSQLGEMYDTTTAMQVLGSAFLAKAFPVPVDPATGVPLSQDDARYDAGMAEVAIAGVLSGKLEEYDVSVGEVVASETQQLAVSAEIAEIAKLYPGIVPPDVLVRHSRLPETAKGDILAAMERQQQMQAEAAMRVSGAGGNYGKN